uniref:ESF1, nucleolar pre-rRNA processing protein, homolog (S. cerevisiae) n=1 Tax=Gasterosteus aculeatus aculeatus TaxID=481459 RepID=G3Q811_GASAC
MSSKKNQGGDERFHRVQKDPRFWEMPERERKIKIDKRFHSMFHDSRFKVKYTVDKRGRPINQTSTEDLKRFYNISDSGDEEEEEEEEGGRSKKEGKQKKKGKEKLVKNGRAVQRSDGGEPPGRGVVVTGEDDDDDDDEKQTGAAHPAEDDDVVRIDSGDDDEEEDGDDEDDDDEEDGDDEEEEAVVASGSDSEEESGLDSEEESDSEPDLARGKGNVETSSDEDEDEVEAILRKEEEEIEHDWGELAKDAPRSDEVSARLAVCNVEWDRIKAKDLLALVNSFVPEERAVLSVKVYPSAFGKERLKAEETQGPMELKPLPEDSEDDTEEERGHREKVRNYQFKRLKYFYAVVECDSADTAAKIYEECDGFEYESSCSVLDLRFIPAGETFEDEPRDVATDVNLSAYTPKLFTAAATATSKVQLTWDETDNDRVTALNRKFDKDELLAMDFKAYLASSSEEEEEGAGFEFGDPQSEDGDASAEGETKEPIESSDETKRRRTELSVGPFVAARPEEQQQQQEEKKKKKKSSRGEEQISKYRELLKSIQEKEKKLHEDKDMGMEVTWVPGLKETTEQLVKKKLEGKDQVTPWEGYLQKKKDKKKQKKSERKEGEDEEELSDEDLPSDVDLSDPFFAEELSAADMKKIKEARRKKKKKNQEEEEPTAEDKEEREKQKAEMALLMEDEGDDAKHKHFNYDAIVEQQNLSKTKRKKLLKKSKKPLEDDDFQVDVQDPRFQAMFTSHLFNLDPSHPSYKKTKATQSIQAEKHRRRGQKEEEEEEERRRRRRERADEAARETRGNVPEAPADEDTPKTSMDPGLSLLIKSIKSKTEQFQARKKPRLA